MQQERETIELTLEPEIRRLVAEPYVLERLATGFIWAEGALWVPDGDYVLFSDIPNDTIHRWDAANGLTVFRHPCGFTNGHTLDREGRLLSCEHQNRRISRTDRDGQITAIATHYEGKRFNSPNDIVVRSDGMIFFTDPPYGAKPDEGDAGARELDWLGVYAVRPDGSELKLLTAEFTAPNGLAFSPDEQHLYVDDSEDMLVRVFDVHPDGSISGGRIVAEGLGSHAARRGVPDGVKVDADGRVWLTGPDGILVFDRNGQQLGVLPLPEIAANLNWGDADRRTLYITASSSLYRVRLNVTGSGVWQFTS